MPFPHSYLGASKGIWAEGNEEKEQERGRDSEKGGSERRDQMSQ